MSRRFVLQRAIGFAIVVAATLADAQGQSSRQELPDSGPGGTSGGVLRPEQAAYDVQRYELRLRVDPAAQSIEGSNRVEVRLRQPLEQLWLDLDDRLQVSRVEGDTGPLGFEHRGGRLCVQLPVVPAELPIDRDLVAVTVFYSGKPRVAPNPPWDGGFTWSTTPSGAPWIATSCQMNGADLWWPCKDHPSDKPETFDLFVTVPQPLVCASNGRLVEESDAGEGWHTFHWHVSTPIANYGVALNIGPYQTLSEEFAGVDGSRFPVIFWVLPESLEKARAALPDFVAQLHFFEQHFGPYPFRGDKYGIVETPHLGMEHQSIIAYGNRFRPDKWGYDWLHHHELSHEWWGNLVTAADWKDLWIHESFGTYCQALYTEQLQGAEKYRERMSSIHSLIANLKPIAPRESTDAARVYDNDKYYKGAWVLHTLRHLLGDAVFFDVLRRMCYPDPALERSTDGSACRFVDTEDFVSLAESISGRELSWFFEVYLRQPELPRLHHEERDGRLLLRWETPSGLLFPMPVDVRVGDSTQRVEMPAEGAVLDLHGASVVIDPLHWVLCILQAETDGNTSDGFP